MIQRGILPSDRDLLAQWLAKDEHHRQETTPDFFYAEGCPCNLYSDEEGPVFFMRGQPMVDNGKKVIRLDIQFDNAETRRNARMLLEVDKVFCIQAKKNGFSEIFFTSESPKLIAFCRDMLGFTENEGILVKGL